MCPLRSVQPQPPSNQDTVYLYGSGRREAPPSGQTAAAPTASATEGGQRAAGEAAGAAVSVWREQRCCRRSAATTL
jgi:hypothetical protein